MQLLTTQRPMLSKSLSSSCPAANSPSATAQHEQYEIPLWPVWVSSPDSVLYLFLVHPWKGSTRSWNVLDGESSAQEQLKYWCVINIILILNPKYSTIPATGKKINFIPAETRTVPYLSYLKNPTVLWHTELSSSTKAADLQVYLERGL